VKERSKAGNHGADQHSRAWRIIRGFIGWWDGSTLKILIVSDIHANLEALEACLAGAPTVDHVANLGDIVGYGANPNEVSKRSREIEWMCVRGNHDKVCVGLEDVGSFNPIAALAAYWTRQTLTPENVRWLRNLPQGPLFPAEIEGVQFVHGSPLDEDEYLIGIEDAAQAAYGLREPITFFGHSHIQGGFMLKNGNPRQLRVGIEHGDKSRRQLFPLESKTHYLINPGSVGQPRDGDWRAAFAVYDDAKHEITFFRVPYDVKSAQEKIRDAGLPERLAARLAQGR
jgi:diadenosine tetraphosphatase ApaH/serine/threonine PP2A family protein phosphatase